MTSTLIVETGAGLANADSYNSMAEVSATLAKTGEDVAWLALASDTVRDQVARKVTRAMDTENRFRGIKKTQEQALEWPREDAFDDDGWQYDSSSLPARLKAAHAALCGIAAGSGGVPIDLQPSLTEPGAVESESVDIAGAISVSTTYIGGKSQAAFYRVAESLMSELTEATGVLERA